MKAQKKGCGGGVVFSKDAYSSGRRETASKEKQGDPTPIFTHFLSGVSQRKTSP